jgi:hypothetical protein
MVASIVATLVARLSAVTTASPAQTVMDLTNRGFDLHLPGSDLAQAGANGLHESLSPEALPYPCLERRVANSHTLRLGSLSHAYRLPSRLRHASQAA